MEIFVLKIISIICVTLLSLAIVISRKDDIGIGSVIIAAILEIIAICVLFGSSNEFIGFIEKIIKVCQTGRSFLTHF